MKTKQPPKPNLIKRWQDLEAAIQDELVAAQTEKPVAWLRFYDTKSAGDFLPQQPADFQACFMAKVFMIEAKFSEVHESLRSCFAGAVQAHQLASARIWTRAQAHYLVVFYSGLSGLVEVWDGLYLAECRSKGERLSLDRRRTYASVKEALAKEIGYA
jgi:hypothetical protein